MANKHIVIGVTAGIAAYKVASLISYLSKVGHEVQVIMTQKACAFITPLTLQTLSKRKVYVDMFASNENYDVKHIEIAKWADLFVVAPASANTIAKLANGLADDMLSTSFLATNCPKLIVPSMNTNMLENRITQDNINKLRHYGIKVMEADSGLLACGDIGKGKFPLVEKIVDEIDQLLVTKKDLMGKKVLISAGPSQESLDPVRYLTNHSSGKMGYALAKEAYNRGADVILVSGPTHLRQPYGINFCSVTSASAMASELLSYYPDADYTIMAAAIADYTPKNKAQNKIKKKEMDYALMLTRTTDVLATMGKLKKHGQILVGFAMETENLIHNAKSKLISKNCDYLIANSLCEKGSGFKADTNHAYLITKDKELDFGLLTKKELAKKIIDQIIKGE